jgi:vacuolar-type H+-ATPase subunit I/STV1
MSSGFLGFLATTKQVDQKLADQDARITQELAEKKAELEKVKKELADLQLLKEQTQAAVKQMLATQEAITELQALAGQVEGRLDNLPTETLQRMIEILQKALNQQAI